MTTLNARANQAWDEHLKASDDVWSSDEKDAFEEGWETGYKTAVREVSHPAEPVGVSDEARAAGLKALLADNGWHKSDGSGVWRANYKRAVDLVLEAAAPMMGATPRPTRDQVAAVWREHTWISDESRCSCGDREIEFMSHHVADAVLALMGGAETTAGE